MFIYLIVNHETGKYYVGQHKGDDLKKYLQQKMSHARLGLSKKSHLFNSMRRHQDRSSWSIHALRSSIRTQEELDRTEKEFIKFLRAREKEFGYNIAPGGRGNSPIRVAKEDDREKSWGQGQPAYTAKHRARLTAERIALWESQDGRCAVCREPVPVRGPHGSYLDKDPATSEVRGILCFQCQNGIKGFRDSQVLLEAAISYLRAFETGRREKRKMGIRPYG